jgi:siderophore synthetase component
MKGAEDIEEHPSGEEEISGRCEGSSKMAVRRGGGDLRQGVEEMIGETRTIMADGLDEEEVKILTHVRAEHPDLEGPFLANVHQGRKEILHRLLQALVRENVAGISSRVTWRSGVEKGLEIQLSRWRTLLVRVRRNLSFGRFDLCGSVTLRDGARCEIVEHPARLLDLLSDLPGYDGVVRDLAGEARLARFRSEVRNSAANYSLALAGASLRRRELAAQVRGSGVRTSPEWARGRTAGDEMFSPLAFYEQLVVDGHPLHPGAKLKLGLSVGNVIRHSPELGAHPEVALVAVAKGCYRDVSLDGRGLTGVLYGEYPSLRQQVANALREKRLNVDDYGLIVVHPWQFERVLPRLYAKAIDRGEVVPLGGLGIPARALMSFRTLAPVQRRGERKHHIKTAVNLQLTGAVRTVSPNAAENAAPISRMLREIGDREGRFGGRFVVLEERAAAYFDPANGAYPPQERRELAKNLTAILREDPEGHVRPGEVPVTASALLAESPVGGGPVLMEVLELFAAGRGIAGADLAAVAFVRRYCEVCLPGFLTVMSRYGVSLEGHLQNSIPVFRGGETVCVLVRDFGGVRILRERLVRQGIRADLYPGSAVVIEDVEDLQNKVYYPVFQNHLGELVACLVRRLDVEEERLWGSVAEVCRGVFRELKGDPAIREQAARDEAALFRPTLGLKAMTTMRLLGDVTRYTFSEVPNPLAQAKSSARR